VQHKKQQFWQAADSKASQSESNSVDAPATAAHNLELSAPTLPTLQHMQH
jgi:hypothetical protein